ncbi:MAG: PD40 domain-containing protein [Deltaproteobacteria bacterium]|nr:PD40 domain-containing protein [Deltaproteobacteria bacterium]
MSEGALTGRRVEPRAIERDRVPGLRLASIFALVLLAVQVGCSEEELCEGASCDASVATDVGTRDVGTVDAMPSDAAFVDAIAASDAGTLDDSGTTPEDSGTEPFDAGPAADATPGLDAIAADAAAGIDATPIEDAATALDATPGTDATSDLDASAPDTGSLDASSVDASSVDASSLDATDAQPDGGQGGGRDSGFRDAGLFADAAPRDSGPDAGPDSGPDAGVGQLIAFASRRGPGDYNLFSMRPDGTGVQQLTTDPAIDLFPSWSTDGRIVFLSTRTGSLALFVYDFTSGQTTPLATPGVTSPSSPVYSPNGSIVAFEGRPSATASHEIWVVPAAGGTPVRLTNNPAVDAGPIFSPDGTRIYFVSDRSGQYEVWSMGLNGSAQTQVTTSSGILGKAAISPDGTRLAWSRLTTDMMRSRIVVEELATHTRTTLTNEDDSEPAYDPAGRYMIFTTTRFGDPEVMRWDLTTGAPAVRLTNDPALDGAAAMSVAL